MKYLAAAPAAPAAFTALLLVGAGCAEAPAAGADGTPAAAQEAGAVQSLDLAVLGWTVGSPDAPVKVVEFSDYGCGYCRRFHFDTWPALLKDFIAPGKIEWKFLPYTSGMFRNSGAATVAAECVLEQGAGAFERMNSLVWDRQAAWKSAGDPAPELREMAVASGADMDRFDTCRAEERPALRVEAANGYARQLGVRGTPTFFVVGYAPIQGALPPEVFLRVMESVYQQAIGGGS